MNNNEQVGTPPELPSEDGTTTTGPNVTNISRLGATTLSETTSISSQNYSSITGGENALLVTGGEVTVDTTTVTKSGDESTESSDFYGTNAAVLATGGLININGGTVTTNGAHANAVFAYGDGTINITNTKITTSADNSGGIMVTGGGHLNATNLTVNTSGNSSAAIRSDRGGGVMSVDGGYYSTSGSGSPAIYSTATISTHEAELISTASEGVVIEGSNSVTLSSSTLTDTNTVLHGNSETYKNIFIYQSMSGDAEEGTGKFTANDSTITTNQGDTFFVTNTTADIQLQNNRIINNDTSSAFLRATASKWGTAGSNGGHVNLTMTGQVAEGDIILDSVSTLNLVLSNSTFYMGAVNNANNAKSVSVTIDATSQLILAGDSYVDSLSNADTTNQNIYSNGYKLYVNGTEVAVNGSERPATPEVNVDTPTQKEEQQETQTNTCANGSFFTECNGSVKVPILVGGISILVIIIAIIAMVIHNKKKKGPSTPKGSSMTMGTDIPMSGGRPDFSAFDDGPVAQPSGPIASSEPETPTTPEAPQAPEAPTTPEEPKDRPTPPPHLIQ